MLLAMVTYTHNDSELLNGLLGGIKRWSVVPAHVFIIDDASNPSYALPDNLKSQFGGSASLNARTNTPDGRDFPGVDVIRPGKHLGPAQAKSFGIALAFDAGASVVLSVDSDVRLPRHWLKEGLSMLEHPDVGLVGADLEHGLAGDVLSGYLREFESVPHGIVDTQFLGAGVWLMRQDVWRAAGGLAGHEQYTHEDLYFSNRLKRMGYILIAHNDPPASQVRRLRASTHFNRQLRYLGFAIFGVAKEKGIEAALALIAEQSETRLAAAARLKKFGYAYVELLWIASLLIYLAGRGVMGRPDNACQAVIEQLKSAFSGFPETVFLLRQDLAAMRLIEADFQINSAFFPASESPALKDASAADSSTATDISLQLFSLWKKYPELLKRLEDGEADVILKENTLFSFSGHYLE